MKYWNYGFVAVGAAAALALGLAGPGSAKPGRGMSAPDFKGTTLEGRALRLGDFRGKNPVVLNFYADFCPPCRREFPHLKALDEKLGPKGLKVVAVSLDADRQTAAALPRQQKVKFPVLFDPKGEIAGKYEVQAIPHTVVIDREGKVHSVLIGLDPEALDRAVEQVMK